MLKRFVSLATVLVLLVSSLCFSTAVSADGYVTFDVTITRDVGNKVIITATIPAGIGSGRILLNVSDDLVYVTDSLTSSVNGMCNDEFEVGDYSGLNVSFANSTYYEEGSEVFRAEFTAVEGAEITEDDVTVSLWNLTDGVVRLATEKDGDVNKAVVTYCTVTFVAGDGGSLEGVTSVKVAVGSAVEDIAFPTPTPNTNYRFKAWSVTDGLVNGDLEISASFYLIGDINFDDITDNLDAAYALRHDAGISPLSGDALLVGDVNFDGVVDSLDAATILKLDAGIIKNF